MHPTVSGIAPRPTDKEGVYRWLEKQLGIDDLPGDLILSITRSEHLDRALDPNYSGGLEKCMAAAEKWLQRNPDLDSRPRSRNVSKSPVALEKLLGPGVCARAQLQLELARDLAHSDTAVVAFREDVLGGRVLEPSEAADLIMSDATVLLNPREFREEQIPIVGHKAQLCAANGAPTAMLLPGGYLDIKWSDDQRRVPLKAAWRKRDWLSEHSIAYPGRDLTPQRRTVYRGSVLDRLASLAKRLGEQLLWDEHETVWFILTHQPLFDSALHGRVLARRSPKLTLGKIQLTIEPWVPAARVLAVYRAAQREHFKIGRKSSGARKFELYRFLERRGATRDGPLDYNSLMGLWNAAQRKKSRAKKIYTSVKSFHRDCTRAKLWVAREIVTPLWPLLALRDRWDTLSLEEKLMESHEGQA